MRGIQVAVLPLLAAPSAAAAKTVTLGTGQNPGVAIDDAGTAYVAWQINTDEPGDAVQFCLIPLRRSPRFCRRIAPSTVLRRVSFRSTPSARRGFRSKFRARYVLRRRHARIPVRVIPRRGEARTLRLRVRRCGATR